MPAAPGSHASTHVECADDRLVAPRRDGAPRWIATTDADTTVPADWLMSAPTVGPSGRRRRDGSRARRTDRRWLNSLGAAAPRRRAASGRARPSSRVRREPRRATRPWWSRVGGFPPVTSSEDELFVRRLRTAGARVLGISDSVVVTSGRLVPRAPLGFRGPPGHDGRRVADRLTVGRPDGSGGGWHRDAPRATASRTCGPGPPSAAADSRRACQPAPCGTDRDARRARRERDAADPVARWSAGREPRRGGGEHRRGACRRRRVVRARARPRRGRTGPAVGCSPPERCSPPACSPPPGFPASATTSPTSGSATISRAAPPSSSPCASHSRPRSPRRSSSGRAPRARAAGSRSTPAAVGHELGAVRPVARLPDVDGASTARRSAPLPVRADRPGSAPWPPSVVATTAAPAPCSRCSGYVPAACSRPCSRTPSLNMASFVATRSDASTASRLGTRRANGIASMTSRKQQPRRLALPHRAGGDRRLGRVGARSRSSGR